MNTFSSAAHIKGDALPLVAPKVQGEEDAGPYAFSMKDADRIIHKDFDRLKRLLTPDKRILTLKTLEDHKEEAARAVQEATEAKDMRDVRIRAAAAATMVALREE